MNCICQPVIVFFVICAFRSHIWYVHSTSFTEPRHEAHFTAVIRGWCSWRRCWFRRHCCHGRLTGFVLVLNWKFSKVQISCFLHAFSCNEIRWKEHRVCEMHLHSLQLNMYKLNQRTVMKIWCLNDNGITTLTCWSHVTSSVTWPFDSRWADSYGWSIVTTHLSCNVMAPQTLDARTNAQVILYLSNTMHCIEQTSRGKQLSIKEHTKRQNSTKVKLAYICQFISDLSLCTLRHSLIIIIMIISVLVQRFNAVLLHNSLAAADCTDWQSCPPLYCVVNF